MPEPALLLLVVVVLAVARRGLGDLRAVPMTLRTDDRSLCVVVPARDEEATLGAVLAPFRGTATEVVVVDDGSRDRTAEVARAAGARVLAAGPPPAGWTGKAWACHVGAGATDTELVLFLDADTVLAPGALGGLLELHERHGGLVSVQPFHEVRRHDEHLSAYFNVVALLASGAFGTRPPGRPVAFGPCLLTSRADHERAGGHAAVRGEILDDVRLAAAYERAGLPVRCWVGGDAVRMRSYPGGLRQLVAGWTKNIASGASAAGTRPTLVAVLWLSVHHAVAAGSVLTAVESLTGADVAWGHPAAWAAAWVLVASQLRSLLRAAGSFAWWTWALFPVPLLLFDVVFLRSAAHTLVGRSVRWRGREVDLPRRSAEGGA